MDIRTVIHNQPHLEWERPFPQQKSPTAPLGDVGTPNRIKIGFSGELFLIHQKRQFSNFFEGEGHPERQLSPVAVTWSHIPVQLAKPFHTDPLEIIPRLINNIPSRFVFQCVMQGRR